MQIDCQSQPRCEKRVSARKTRSNLPLSRSANANEFTPNLHCFSGAVLCSIVRNACIPRDKSSSAFDLALCLQISRRRHNELAIKCQERRPISKVSFATMGRARRHENTHRNSKSAHERTRELADLSREAQKSAVCRWNLGHAGPACTQIHNPMMSYSVYLR